MAGGTRELTNSADMPRLGSLAGTEIVPVVLANGSPASFPTGLITSRLEGTESQYDALANSVASLTTVENNHWIANQAAILNHSTRLTTLEANTVSGRVIKETYAALAALVPSTGAGTGGEVLDTDVGTHTDPVVGGTKANAGVYTYSTSPAGWKWIGATGIGQLTVSVNNLNSLFRDNDTRNYYNPALGDAAQNFVYNNGTGAPGALNAAAVSGKIFGGIPGERFVVDLWSCPSDWVFYDLSNVHFYNAAGVWLSYSGATVTVNADGRYMYVTLPAGAYAFAFSLKYLSHGTFDTTNNTIPAGAFAQFQNSVMVSKTPTGAGTSWRAYDASPPFWKPEETFWEFWRRKASRVALVMHKNSIFIRTKWDQTYDLVRHIIIGEPATLDRNSGIDFRAARLVLGSVELCRTPGAWALGFNVAGLTLTNVPDDMPPVLINGVFLAGNHGFPARNITCSAAHLKTTADIGSLWSDGAGRQWVLQSIDSPTRLTFLPFTNLSVAADPIGMWLYYGGVMTTPISHVSGATHTSTMAIIADVAQQVHNAKAVTFTEVYADNVFIGGGTPQNGLRQGVSEGIFICDSVQLTEKYSVKTLPQLIAWMRTHIGNPSTIDPAVEDQFFVSLSYNAVPSGMWNFTYDLYVQRTFHLNYFGAQQWGAMSIIGAGEALIQGIIDSDTSVPASDGLTPLDFKTGADVSANGKFYFSDSLNWRDATKPPMAYWSMVRTSGVNKAGFAFGYSDLKGVTKPATRLSFLTSTVDGTKVAMQLSSAEKQYPYAVFDRDVTQGEYFQVCGWFGHYYTVNDLVNVVYEEGVQGGGGGYAVMVFATASTYPKNFIAVPNPRYHGKKITRLDSDPAVTLYSEVVSRNGVLIAVSAGGGSMRLKFDD